ncbi:hypothetical protein E0L10_13860 [Enterococcus durans]|uniref:hypothetical protein n=2 Tax=Enterococcus TaxID=1350 RepID=UPI00143001F6|nr:hypothetical protein [Enterococcus durans]NJE65143.1 hypothetical protein [Enterococcus durans]
MDTVISIDIHKYFEDPEELQSLFKQIQQIETIDNLLSIICIYKIEKRLNNKDEMEIIQNVINKHPKFVNKLKRIIGKSLNKKNADEWLIEFLNVDDEYKGIMRFFHELFFEYKYWENLSSDCMKKYLDSDFVDYNYILKKRSLTDKYSEEIIESMVNCTKNLRNNINLIINDYRKGSTLNFPAKFENSNYFQIMVNKLISEQEKNGVRDIRVIDSLIKFNSSKFPLNEETRSRISEYIDDYWKEIDAEKTHGVIQNKFNLTVSIVKQADDIKISDDSNEISVSINEKLLEGLEYEQVLPFITKYIILDKYQRLNSISNPVNQDISLLSLLGKDLQSYGNNNITFDLQNQAENLIVGSTIDYLYRKKGFVIEEILADYFNNKIEKEFQIKGFSMRKISSHLPYDIRIPLLAIELESILKQYQLLVTYEKIELKYLSYMPPLDIEKIDSLLPKKYIQVSYEKIPVTQDFIDIRNLFKSHSYVSRYIFDERVIEQMEIIDSCISYSTLFSQDEIDFLNYCLNNKKFNNSLAIRNKYLHGSTIYFKSDQHKANYLLLIKIFIIIYARINEELTLKKYIDSSEES